MMPRFIKSEVVPCASAEMLYAEAIQSQADDGRCRLLAVNANIYAYALQSYACMPDKQRTADDTLYTCPRCHAIMLTWQQADHDRECVEGIK